MDSKFRNLQASRGQLKASRAAQEATREKLKETMDAFNNGTALTKDVLQTQSHLAQAGSEYQKSLDGFWTPVRLPTAWWRGHWYYVGCQELLAHLRQA